MPTVTGSVACATAPEACRASWFACRTPVEPVGCRDMLKNPPDKPPERRRRLHGLWRRSRNLPDKPEILWRKLSESADKPPVRATRLPERGLETQLRELVRRNLRIAWPEASGRSALCWNSRGWDAADERSGIGLAGTVRSTWAELHLLRSARRPPLRWERRPSRASCAWRAPGGSGSRVA